MIILGYLHIFEISEGLDRDIDMKLHTATQQRYANLKKNYAYCINYANEAHCLINSIEEILI